MIVCISKGELSFFVLVITGPRLAVGSKVGVIRRCGDSVKGRERQRRNIVIAIVARPLKSEGRYCAQRDPCSFAECWNLLRIASRRLSLDISGVLHHSDNKRRTSTLR